MSVYVQSKKKTKIMKFIKLFENFSDVNSELNSVLKKITSSYEKDLSGGTVHPSEDFDDGSSLMQLIGTLIKGGEHDNRICSILRHYAMLCKAESNGGAEHLSDYIDDDDYEYINNFLGIEKKSDVDASSTAKLISTMSRGADGSRREFKLGGGFKK